MGVLLTPIILKRELTLDSLRGLSFAVDANNYLYQFLALVRKPDGSPLTDMRGNITSHLAGLAFRTTRLIHDYGLRLVFVFDGKPPELKRDELEKRRLQKKKAEEEWIRALSLGDYAAAFSKAVMTGRLTEAMIHDAKKLLELLGIPYIQAAGEAEAQCAYMAIRGDVWAASSKDYDSLVFGAPRLVRYLTIHGKEWLPSKGKARPLKPELIELEKLLAHHSITREQLIDIAILIGTDFNEGIRGIGPKKALSLIKRYGKIEALPSQLRGQLEEQNYGAIRRIYLEPQIVDNYAINYTKIDEAGVYRFLCDERDFSYDRVKVVVERMKLFYQALDRQEKLGWE
ncbi:MAG: flap endonuclease-1 [Aigarchaeota archaeon]|nr:flap endonuclease-1 [Candidatus Pelearchaeum maunauluense]